MKTKEALINCLYKQIAALAGAQKLAYLFDMSRFLRSIRLALCLLDELLHASLTRMFHKLTRALTCLLINKKDFAQSGVRVTTPLPPKTSLLIKILRNHHVNL